jgi:hypothetical protein
MSKLIDRICDTKFATYAAFCVVCVAAKLLFGVGLLVVWSIGHGIFG